MGSVRLDQNGFILDGKRLVLLVGSLFYFRLPRASWRDRMEKMKAAGYHALDVYFPWNHHELARDVWDFSGERDVGAFLNLAQEVGLYVVARPGPYICSEWDGGGLPAYLFPSTMRVRDNDPAYLKRVQLWFDRILPLLRDHSFSRNGCVIAMQLENELDFYAESRDRHGYIRALQQMALAAGIDVPLFCCAGQGGLGACGGLLPGLYPAMNFYPSKTDNHFGEQARFYRDWLSDRGFPLLVTETNRDHHFLRLLLLLGVKLLGPYNQAGGTDFGYTTAVNNWGAPLSFQTSDYEFASLLSPVGEFNRSMLPEARILRDLMDAIPGLNLAQPAPLPEGFHVPENVFATALSLPEGGLIAGGMGYGSESAEAVWPDTGCRIAFAPGYCAFFMSNVSLKPLGLDVEINFANATPVRLSKDGLVFAAEQPVTQIVLNGQAKTPAKGETWTVDGIPITLLPWKEAAKRHLPYQEATEKSAVSVPLALSCAQGKRADLFAALPARKVENGSLSLEANGVLRGCGLYQAQVSCENLKGILLADAADLVAVTLDDACLGTHSPQGHPIFLPAPSMGKQTRTLQVAAEIWGHCNFDDPRAPSLRIQSTRGVRSIVAVSSATPLALWQRTDAVAGIAPQLMPLGVWLTSETPARGTFSILQPVSCSVRVLHFQGLEAKAEVYVAGRLAGAVDRYRPWLDISALPAEDGILRLECRVTQQDYTQRCGVPMLYQGEPVRDVTLQALGEAELAQALRAADPQKTSDLTLPLRLRAGQTAALHAIIPAEDCELTLEGRNVKVTVLRGKHICGRLILNAPGFPPMRGGRPDRAYLPGCWGVDFYAYVESLGDDAELSAIRCRTTGVFQPA